MQPKLGTTVILIAIVFAVGAGEPKIVSQQAKLKAAVAAFDKQMERAAADFRTAFKKSDEKLIAEIDAAKKAAMQQDDLKAANAIEQIRVLHLGSAGVIQMYETVTTQGRYKLTYTTGRRKGFGHDIRFLPFGQLEDNGQQAFWYIGTVNDGVPYVSLIYQPTLLPPKVFLYCVADRQRPGVLHPDVIMPDEEDDRNFELTPIQKGGPVKAILRQIEDLGFAVKEFRANGVVEFHAVPLAGGEPQIARCNDGDGPDEEYRAACLLAEACGIDLEDG